MGTKRWLPLAGIVFVVVFVVGGFILGGSTPDSNASAAKAASYYDSHATRHVLVAFLVAASTPFLVFFAAAVASALGDARAARAPIWERVFVGGSAVSAAVLLVVAAIHFALADGAHNGLAPSGVQALNVVDGDSWIAFNAAFGVMMLGAAGSFLPRLGTERWLGWAALVLGVALFIPFADFFALLLTGVWIIVVSIRYARLEATPGLSVSPGTA